MADFSKAAHYLMSTGGAQDGPERGHVYIIAEKTRKNEYTGFYKIGKTKQDLSERLRNLQTGNPRKLEYLEFVEVVDINAAESRAHAAATKRRFKSDEGGGTEWYIADPQYLLDLKVCFESAVHGRSCNLQ